MIDSLRVLAAGKHRDLLTPASLRSRFTSGAVWSLTGAMLSRGSILAASVACARLLGKAGFGELGMIQSTVGMFGIFAGLGLGLTATKYVAEFREKDPERVGRILALSSLAALVSGAVMTALLVVVAPFLAEHTLGAAHLAGPLAIGVGLVLFGAMNGVQTGALTGLEAFQAIAYVNLWAGLGTFLLVLCGAWYKGLAGAVCGLVAAIAVNWVLNHRALRRECARAHIRYHFPSFRKEWRVLYQFSLPAFLAAIILGPAMWACNALLVHQPNGYTEMGLYTAADKWRLLILFVPTSVAGMVLPMLSNLHGVGDPVGYSKVFNANLLLNLGLTALPAVAVAFFASPILAIYGASYRSARLILVILAFSAIPESLNNVFGYAVISSHSVWWRLGFDILLAGNLLGFSWWAIPRWGAVGLAAAYCLAFSTATMGLLLFLRTRRFRTPGQLRLRKTGR